MSASNRLLRKTGAFQRALLRGVLQWTSLPDVVRVRGYTHCSLARLRALQHHVATLRQRRIAGAVVECGVAAGGTAAVMALALQRSGPRDLILFDTFAGLPAPSLEDPDYEIAQAFTGTCEGSVADVERLFARLKLPVPVCVPGLFQHTIECTPTEAIALLHLDGDWYDSTRTCLRALWPRLSEGGIVQIDDYGYWQGCRRAVDEFFSDHPQRLHRIDSTGVWLEKHGE